MLPESETRELVERLLDSDVDLIADFHPHVVRPVEECDDKLVAYSLGNFVSWQTKDYTYFGIGLALDIIRSGERTGIAKTNIVPFYRDRSQSVDTPSCRVISLDIPPDELINMADLMAMRRYRRYFVDTYGEMYEPNFSR